MQWYLRVSAGDRGEQAMVGNLLVESFSFTWVADGHVFEPLQTEDIRELDSPGGKFRWKVRPVDSPVGEFSKVQQSSSKLGLAVAQTDNGCQRSYSISC